MSLNILLASGNKGKIEEFQEFFKDINCQFYLLAEALGSGIENGNSFYENALKKAQAAALQIHKHKILTNCQYCLADDSGLCIEALNGEPGIYAGRYFADGAGLNKILKRMQNINNRKAYFVSCLVLVDSTGQYLWHTEKSWQGQIAGELKGNKGFGYDPLFIPEGYNCTVAQMPFALKNKLSHRFQTMQDFKIYITDN